MPDTGDEVESSTELAAFAAVSTLDIPAPLRLFVEPENYGELEGMWTARGESGDTVAVLTDRVDIHCGQQTICTREIPPEDPLSDCNTCLESQSVEGCSGVLPGELDIWRADITDLDGTTFVVEESSLPSNGRTHEWLGLYAAPNGLALSVHDLGEHAASVWSTTLPMPPPDGAFNPSIDVLAWANRDPALAVGAKYQYHEGGDIHGLWVYPDVGAGPEAVELDLRGRDRLNYRFVNWSADRTRIVAARNSTESPHTFSSIEVWSSDDGRHITTLAAGAASAGYTAVTAGRRNIVAGLTADGRIVMWDVDRALLLVNRELNGRDDVPILRTSNDGRWIVAIHDAEWLLVRGE